MKPFTPEIFVLLLAKFKKSDDHLIIEQLTLYIIWEWQNFELLRHFLQLIWYFTRELASLTWWLWLPDCTESCSCRCRRWFIWLTFLWGLKHCQDQLFFVLSVLVPHPDTLMINITQFHNITIIPTKILKYLSLRKYFLPPTICHMLQKTN